MLIWLLLLLALIAGATCLWLLLRVPAGVPAAAPAVARTAAAVRAAEPPPEPTPGLIAAAPVLAPLDPPQPGEEIAAPPDPGLDQAQIFARLHELALGPLVKEPAPERELLILRSDAALNFGRLATEPQYAMRRPLLLPQLLQAVNDRNTNQHELVKIITKDPALAGSLLKVANSPAYRVREKPVESLERAVALVGMDGLHSLIAMALVQPIFKLSQAGFPKFPQLVWDHTFKAAAAAESWAAGVNEEERFTAQLLALTMGLGAIVTFRIVVDRCRSLLGGKVVHPATVAAVLNAQVPVVAGKVAASWDLSERVLGALQEQLPPGVDEPPRAPSLLGRALVFGRCLGGLALLREHDNASDEVVAASMLRLGPLPAEFDALWLRLIQKETA